MYGLPNINQPSFNSTNGALTDKTAPFVIAEIGANHNGSMNTAKDMIYECKKAGASAVKFQSWTTELIAQEMYDANTIYEDRHRHFGSLYQMVKDYQLTREQHLELAEYCKKMDIVFLSSVFDMRGLNILEECDVQVHKVASMDVPNLELLRQVGATGKPVLLSTGMSNYGEITRAYETLIDAGAAYVVPLHCTAIYPCPVEDTQLRQIQILSNMFNTPAGFSDHTQGTEASVAAIALGATVIEKHVTIDKNMRGWDHWMSIEMDELKLLCTQVRSIWQATRNQLRVVSETELNKARAFRRSLVLTCDVSAGDEITADMLTSKRPGTGICPSKLDDTIGRRVGHDMQSGAVLCKDDLQ